MRGANGSYGADKKIERQHEDGTITSRAEKPVESDFREANDDTDNTDQAPCAVNRPAMP